MKHLYMTQVIREIDPRLKKDRKQFASLPFLLAKKHPAWRPGLRIFEEELLHPDKNPFWKSNSCRLFVSEISGMMVGRLGFLTPGYLKEHPGAGILIFPDFIQDKDVFAALISHVEQEMRQAGCIQVIGPMNPNIHYDVGIQFQGFTFSNSAFMRYQPPYYLSYFTSAGYTSLADFYAWGLTNNQFLVQNSLVKIEQRILHDPDLRIRQLRTKEFNSELKLFFQLYKDCFQDHWGFVSPNFDEFSFLASDLRYILKDSLALIAEWRGKPVGFVLSIPDVYDAIDKTQDGRLSPRALIHLLIHFRRIKHVRVMIAGVLPEARHMGIHVPLFLQIARNIFAAGYEGGQIAWVMENNAPMTRILTMIGAERQQGYRLLIKQLD